MTIRLTQLATASCLALAMGISTGCDVQSTPTPNGGRTTTIETPPAVPATPNGVHINVDPNAPTPQGNVKVNVDPQNGVNVKVDGQPVRDFLKERRDEAETRPTP